MAAAAGGLVAADVRFAPVRSAPRHLGVLVLAAAFFATGSYVANIHIGRQGHAFQLCDVPRLVGLVFASPGALVAGRLLGALPALVLIRRQPAQKVVFNLANFGLEVATAIAVFAALAPRSAGVGLILWPAALAATASADLLSSLVVGVVISLAEGSWAAENLLAPARVALVTSLAATAVGLIAATVLWYQPSAAILLGVLTGLAMVAQRSYTGIVERNRRQARLHEFLVDLAPLTPADPALGGVLDRARDLLAVEEVALLLTAGEGRAPAVAARVHAEGGPGPEGALAPADELFVRRVLEVARTSSRPTQRQLATPVPGRTRLLGVLMATGPLCGVRKFTDHDAVLLESIAAPLGQALHRGEQQAALAHAASHDALTGLANLTELQRRAGQVVAGPPAAVLLVDVSRLRAINDVFGRDTGDAVLVALARRLASQVPPGAVTGRVGGHHFAVVLPTAEVPSVPAFARALRRSLEAPVPLGAVAADIGVAIGVSLAPLHGREIDVLLRRAEAAVDAAKLDAFGVSVFHRDLEREAHRPLQLLTDLRAALDATPPGAGQLSVDYQPKLCLVTGAILGAEALVRWNHPQLGPVSPEEFVPLAESAGLVGQLTRYVLGEALGALARWDRDGFPGGVAVNLSARSLLDSTLLDLVAGALAAAGVPAERLTLELTETSVMAQPTRSVLVLDALRELGVRLSVDDFGTGYSSLAYLRQLPVQEVKLDRSFLTPLRRADGLGLADSEIGQEFLRHSIALAHSLSLAVVVEGVEDELTTARLRLLGADAVQGYHFCRPLAAGPFDRFWQGHHQTRATGAPAPRHREQPGR